METISIQAFEGIFSYTGLGLLVCCMSFCIGIFQFLCNRQVPRRINTAFENPALKDRTEHFDKLAFSLPEGTIRPGDTMLRNRGCLSLDVENNYFLNNN